MQIEYVGHAALRIVTGDARLLTDPWWEGTAYRGQWHLFPPAVAAPGAFDDTDAILLSHGHEDHLHPPTLRTLPRGARVLYPYGWYGGTREFLQSLGFGDVVEAVTWRRHRVAEGTWVTYVANNLDSIVVVESGGRVLVNVNDALHAHHPRVTDLFVRALARRWPTIDVLFCGFGGASFFPNCYHVEGKDDREVARLREELFVHQFCRIVDGLNPRVAVPFAADFVLPDPAQRWIHDARFPRERIADYYRAHFRPAGDGPRIVPMYPGDVLDDGELRPRSPYRERLRDGGLELLPEEERALEAAHLAGLRPLAADDADRLGAELKANVRRRAALFDAATRERLRFTVRVRDVAENACFDISFPGGAPRVSRGAAPAADTRMVVETRSDLLRCGFESEWGGDAMTIGYGADFHVRDPSILSEGLDTACVQLLNNYPAASRHMRTQPLRGLRFLVQNPLTLRWGASRLRRGNEVNVMRDRSLWLSRSKCDVCRACDLPLLDEAAAERL